MSIMDNDNRTAEFFHEAIVQYQRLEQETINLANEIAALSPEEILNRCTSLQEMQEDIAEKDAALVELMKFIGPDILNTPFLGEYQRALDKAIKASDRVSQKAHAQKAILASELSNIHAGQKGVSHYKTAKNQDNTQLRGKF